MFSSHHAELTEGQVIEVFLIFLIRFKLIIKNYFIDWYDQHFYKKCGFKVI